MTIIAAMLLSAGAAQTADGFDITGPQAAILAIIVALGTFLATVGVAKVSLNGVSGVGRKSLPWCRAVKVKQLGRLQPFLLIGAPMIWAPIMVILGMVLAYAVIEGFKGR